MSDEKRSWIVKVRATVIKTLVCDDCTLQEAKKYPFDHATDEVEDHQEDWAVIDVAAND